MKRFLIEDHGNNRFTVYLQEKYSDNIEEWLRKKEDVIHVVNAKKCIMVDFSPRCEKQDIDNIISDLKKMCESEKDQK
jgi:hypothetical protein